VKTLILALAASSVFASGAALAASPKLKGSYAETGETVCIFSTTVRGPQTPPAPGPVTPSGFNPVTLTPNPGAFTSLFLFSSIGVRTFDGQGSGTLQARNVSINSSPNIFPNTFVPAGGATDIAGAFTYEVAPDGSISIVEDVLGSILAGTRAGQTVTNNGIALTGRASNNRDSLVLATDVPQIESLSFSNGDQQERICHRTRTLIRTGD
jgi:hypothetical protein